MDTNAVIAGSSLSAHWNGSPVAQDDRPKPTPCCAVLDNPNQFLLERVGDQRMQHSLPGFWSLSHQGLERSSLSKLESLDANDGIANSIVQDDPDKFGECCRIIPRTADCRRKGGHE